mmetsp:Transcript_6394/g.17106  ORF Transcript_6394/g.17106 Transcript_6394/m.17106 type:complete len:405 (+) Transcript_6394:244-1458(+)
MDATEQERRAWRNPRLEVGSAHPELRGERRDAKAALPPVSQAFGSRLKRFGSERRRQLERASWNCHIPVAIIALLTCAVLLEVYLSLRYMHLHRREHPQAESEASQGHAPQELSLSVRKFFVDSAAAEFTSSIDPNATHITATATSPAANSDSLDTSAERHIASQDSAPAQHTNHSRISSSESAGSEFHTMQFGDEKLEALSAEGEKGPSDQRGADNVDSLQMSNESSRHASQTLAAIAEPADSIADDAKHDTSSSGLSSAQGHEAFSFENFQDILLATDRGESRQADADAAVRLSAQADPGNTIDSVANESPAGEQSSDVDAELAEWDKELHQQKSFWAVLSPNAVRWSPYIVVVFATFEMRALLINWMLFVRASGTERYLVLTDDRALESWLTERRIPNFFF